jgi:hypothetical protein
MTHQIPEVRSRPGRIEVHLRAKSVDADEDDVTDLGWGGKRIDG